MDFAEYLEAHRRRRAEADAALSDRVAAAHIAASEAARRIGEALAVRGVALFGSLATGRFGARSDIDLAIDGLPDGELTRAHQLASAAAPGFDVNVVTLDSAAAFIRASVARDGIRLWPR